jgi:hypothetical protein
VGVRCTPGSTNEADSFGTIVPRNSEGQLLAFILAKENFDDALPGSLGISASAAEYDLRSAPCGSPIPPCDFDGSGCTSACVDIDWVVPVAVERHVKQRRVSADDRGTGFRSSVLFTLAVFHDDQAYLPAGSSPVVNTWR